MQRLIELCAAPRRSARAWRGRILIVAGLLAVLLGGFGPVQAATITVNTRIDAIDNSDGLCTLREAIFAANFNFAFSNCATGSNTGEDVIVFTASVFPPPLNIAIINLQGQLVVGDNSLRIQVPSNAGLTLVGNGSEPIFSVTQDVGATFALNRTSLSGGFHADPGGAIAIEGGTGLLELTEVTVQNNESAMFGGGIGLNSPDPVVVMLTNSTVRFNTAGTAGGGIGGEVPQDSSIMLMGTTVQGNTAVEVGGGVFLEPVAGVTNVDVNTTAMLSRFIGNTAGGAGGAIHSSGRSNSLNRAFVSVDDSLFMGNASTDGSGGAIGVFGVITQSTGQVNVRRSSFIDNTAAGSGGALVVNSINAALVNNTFIGNVGGIEGAVALGYLNSASAINMAVIGNTFQDNEGGADTGNSVAWDLSVTYPSAAGSVIRYVGNVFNSEVMFDRPCRFTTMPAAATFFGGYNRVLNTFGASNCIENPNDLIVDDMRLELRDVTDPIHVRAAFPLAGSPLIDAWTESACRDENNNLLETHMLGNRRTAGVPANGNPLTPADCDSGAIESPQGRLLTVMVDGTGAGTVASDPVGIDCGAQCVAPYPLASEVTLTASAAPGSMFAGWSGDCSGTGPCVVTMSTTRNVTATFALIPTTFDVNVSVQGGGVGTVTSNPSGIQCPAMCSASFEENTLVTLEAMAAADSVFMGWGGDCAAAGTGPCQLTITGDVNVTADFQPAGELLQVTLEGNGTGVVTSSPANIDCPGNCEAFFMAGTSVTLSAVPDGGFVFQGWSGDCSGMTCQLLMDQPRSVRAVFVEDDTVLYDSFE